MAMIMVMLGTEDYIWYMQMISRCKINYMREANNAQKKLNDHNWNLHGEEYYYCFV